MNPGRLIHSVTGERAPVTFASGKRVRVWAAINGGAAIPVLIEGLPGRIKQAIMGYIPQARYRITWEGGSDIEEGDRLTYDGNEYFVAEVTDDTTRPTGAYKTAILTRKPID